MSLSTYVWRFKKKRCCSDRMSLASLLLLLCSAVPDCGMRSSSTDTGEIHWNDPQSCHPADGCKTITSCNNDPYPQSVCDKQAASGIQLQTRYFSWRLLELMEPAERPPGLSAAALVAIACNTCVAVLLLLLCLIVCRACRVPSSPERLSVLTQREPEAQRGNEHNYLLTSWLHKQESNVNRQKRPPFYFRGSGLKVWLFQLSVPFNKVCLWAHCTQI